MVLMVTEIFMALNFCKHLQNTIFTLADNDQKTKCINCCNIMIIEGGWVGGGKPKVG